MTESLDLSRFEQFSTGVSSFTDAGLKYIHLPSLNLPEGCDPPSSDALLCLDERDGYATRLFFAERIQSPARPLNWHMSPTVAGRVWQAYSWKGVQPAEPVAVLIGHLNAFVP